MSIFQIEVRAITEQHDAQAHRLAREISHLPLKQIPAGDRKSAWIAGSNLSQAHSLSKHQMPLTIQTAQLYFLTGYLSPTQIEYLVKELLVDPVVQEATIIGWPDDEFSEGHDKSGTRNKSGLYVVDVFFHPGVTDTLAESILAGALMLGISGIECVETGRRYIFDGRLDEDDVRLIANALLYNPVIQHFVFGQGEKNTLQRADESARGAINRPPTDMPLSDMSDQQLLAFSKKGLLALNLDEMRAIQQHYREQRREPTDVELETLAQTWSEHCSHKTFKATIVYREQDSDGNILAEETISNLLKDYVMQATETVMQNCLGDWVVSAFSDNAGIIRFTETQDIAFKVETHNHPSAIEPFGGANTGVGGVIRDVLGVSAQPIACTDILCFGPLDTPTETLPAGVLSPRRIASGVVDGVRDYGNKMGIPTVNGAILYHEGYLYNPLVFCGCLGILPHGSHPRRVQVGDHIVILGGRTGRDGIHGATFSSGEMSSEINAQVGSAVQIGAPITEKKVADVILQARDRQLYHAITDCGAGGFSSAIGEMGAETGAYVELDKAPVKYQGLAPWEIWLSEAQERMVLAVPPEHLDELVVICAIEEVEASVIGNFTADRRLVVTYQSTSVADMEMEFLHEGRPGRQLEALWIRAKDDTPEMVNCLVHTSVEAFSTTLLSLLSHPSIASKEAVVRRYDHEVQGATLHKPLVGRAGNGPGDGAVLQPILEEPTSHAIAVSRAGIVLSNGINPLYGKIDPYHMAMNAVDEALRNLTAVGGDIERAAILDNFCWGNPTVPLQLGMLVRAVKGCHDAAIGFGTPFISGKDSLNNEYRAGEQRLPVIPTLLISAVGVIEDAGQTVDMSLKSAGDLLYQIGTTYNELAGSHFMEVSQVAARLAPAAAARLAPARGATTLPGTAVPHVDVVQARATMKALGTAIRKGLVQACHDLSEGGLAVAAAEMALAGMLGMMLNVNTVHIDVGKVAVNSQSGLHPNIINTIALFSESASRFMIEVAPEQREVFEAHMKAYNACDFVCIGMVTETKRFQVHNGDDMLMDLSIEELQRAWRGEKDA